MKVKMILLFTACLFSLGIKMNAQVGNYYVNLSSPMDFDTISEDLPMFIWQCNLSSVMEDPRLTQRFVLCELKSGQSKGMAIQQNVPLMLVDELEQNSISYSSNLSSLEAGKTYVWQVSQVFSGAIVQQSEVFQFTMDIRQPKGNFLALTTDNNTMIYSVEDTYLRVSISENTDLDLSAELTDSKGKKYKVLLQEWQNGQILEESTSKASTAVRFFVLDMKKAKLKKGVYHLKWQTGQGKEYHLSFENN